MNAKEDDLPYITSVKLSEANECQKAIEEIKSEKNENINNIVEKNIDIKKIVTEKIDSIKIVTAHNGDDNNTDNTHNSNDDNSSPNNGNDSGAETIPLSKLHSINDVDLLTVGSKNLPGLTKSLGNLV